MRAVVMHEPGNVTVEEMPMPTILEPTDAIIRLAATCICGSDLWPYRGAQPVHEQRMGHEYVGTVVEVGSVSYTHLEYSYHENAAPRGQPRGSYSGMSAPVVG